MSADIASYHGGDGGDLDPSDSSKVLSTCEAAPSPKRKGRVVAINIPLETRRRGNQGPLPLTLDPATENIVGLENQALIR
uniref:Uncharacterized protein n=1 Tax=Cannabis sativa TaxID=3483 RepID=A0A803QDW6_CANSA